MHQPVGVGRLAREPEQRFCGRSGAVWRVVDGLQWQEVGVEDTAHAAQSIGEEVLPVAGGLLLTEDAVAVLDEAGGVRAGGAGEDVVESRLHVEQAY